MVPLLGVLVLVLILSVLSMMAVVAWWKFKRESKNVNEPKGGALTYTNPTYSASNSDVNTDRKPFTWRRLHSDNVHQVGCVYTFVHYYHVASFPSLPVLATEAFQVFHRRCILSGSVPILLQLSGLFQSS